MDENQPSAPDVPLAKPHVQGIRKHRNTVQAAQLLALSAQGIPGSAAFGPRGDGWADRAPDSYTPEQHIAALARAEAKRERRAARNLALVKP